MLSGILEIGRILSESEINTFLKNKIDYGTIKRKLKKLKKPEIVRVIFEPSERKIRFVSENYDESKLEKYLWVGNPKGRTSPKRLTSDNLVKIFTRSIFNAQKSLEDGELKTILKEIISKFTCIKGNKKVIDLSLIEDLSEELRKKWEDIQNFAKEDEEKTGQILKHYLDEKFSPVLFTLYYKEKSLVEFEEYKRMLYNEFVEEAFGNTQFGVCHGCGKETKVTKDFSKFELKFFINQKLNFASGVDEDGFYKNFVLCNECYTAFSLGEKFLMNNLKVRFENIKFPCYVIPDFYDMIPSSEILRIQAKQTIQATELLDSFDKFNEYRENLEEKIETNSFALNFVFVEEQRAAVKIRKLIMDVPPSRIKEIIVKRNKIYERFVKLTSEKLDIIQKSKLDFKRIAELFPHKKDSPGIVLEIYDSILAKKMLIERELIKNFLEVVRVYYNNNSSSEFHSKSGKKKKKTSLNSDYQAISNMLASNQFLLYARELNILQGGVGEVDYKELDILSTDLREYIELLKLDEQRTGLFLVGVLLAEIATAQFDKGNGKKVILEKVNYYGMTQSKVKMFISELFEKLRHYKVLNTFTELVHFFAKKYLDMCDRNWILSPQENVYWILSGYAYQTMKTITGSQRSNERSNEFNGEN